MQAISEQLGLKKGHRQAAMRDQDRERAMAKGAAYRERREAALQEQRVLLHVEQKHQAAEELHHLFDVYGRRVAGMGKAHADAMVLMQQQHQARAEQAARQAELEERQLQRAQAALWTVKTQQEDAKAQRHGVQRRRAEILRTERCKAQSFSTEQAERQQAQKRRQEELLRQEEERRKRSANGLAVDFRSTRLHEGHVSVTPAPVAVAALPAPPLPRVPDPVESAEDYQHRLAMEKRQKELAALEAEARKWERFRIAQAKERSEAQRRMMEAEMEQLEARRLVAKKEQLARHRQ
ncbi:hypothetical protein GPECTOR_44g26 [Gonium pectorale]|uniref:Uncharacterized protein n=1 Tax=Gonium pectorale TaxID=33097 RepID=A0A150G925_GONPE|nr:hypothetical protein GPECTOR_44g26 [Gonium pectorale]|eukprot:KXZ46347.1 hypothetical protein GPECTOR_44g26 [Gonium pectorale]